MKRAAIVIALLCAACLKIRAQEVSPNASPSTTTKGSAVGKLNGQQKTDKTQSKNPAGTPVSSCIQCPNCCPIEQPHTPSEEEKAQAASLDRLYRHYMWATIIGVGGGFIGLGLIFWQNVLTRRAVNAASKSADAFIRSERAWVVADLVQMAVKMPPPENWCRIVKGGLGVMSAEAILRGEYLRHRLKFTNMGRTAARISAYEFHCGFYDHKRKTLQIENISYNMDYDRTLGAGNEILTDDVIDIHEFLINPAAEVGPPSWKNWMIVLVSVTYDHVLSDGSQNEVFRFVFDINAQTMRRAATTREDKEQIGKREIRPI